MNNLSNSELLIQKTIELFSFLEEYNHFIAYDTHNDYGNYVLYRFQEETDDFLYEGNLYIPTSERNSLNWDFSCFKKESEYYILDSEINELDKTFDWFKHVFEKGNEILDKRDRIRKVFVHE